jgi:hypothetical protein
MEAGKPKTGLTDSLRAFWFSTDISASQQRTPQYFIFWTLHFVHKYFDRQLLHLDEEQIKFLRTLRPVSVFPFSFLEPGHLIRKKAQTKCSQRANASAVCHFSRKL